MGEKRTTSTTIDEYISEFSMDIRERMQALRNVIRAAAPEAQEKISWAMPTFWQNGNLVHFAGFKKHIGLYPGANGIEQFRGRLDGYAVSKGGVQFPHDKPIPLDVVRQIVEFKVKENTADE